jgi:hypothetical protein
MTSRRASHIRRACVAVTLALLVCALAPPLSPLQQGSLATALAKSAKPKKPKHKKKRGFVRRGVSYAPYVPPHKAATTSAQLMSNNGDPCGGLLRSDRWPAGRRLTAWRAYGGPRPDADGLGPGGLCPSVKAFVDRLALTPATDGNHNVARNWACDFAAPSSTCTHQLPDGSVDLSVVFDPPGTLSAARHAGLTVAPGDIDPTPGPTEHLSVRYAFEGTTQFLVVGKRPCGPSAAATQAAMEAAGGLLFADDRLSGDVYLRPRGGEYHACLFWQEHDTDTHAVAVVQTTFTWFA